MNQKLLLLASVASALLLPSPKLFAASVKPEEEMGFRVEPIFTRFAETSPEITLNGTLSYFEGVELQEADHFDGYTSSAELIIPFLHRFQVRVFYPIYTDGQARLIDPHNPVRGKRIDIHGAGGIFDYATLGIDYEFLKAHEPGDWSLAVGVGGGAVIRYLDTTAPATSGAGNDRYNHSGKIGLLGFMANRNIGEDWTLLLNLGARLYFDSDDLHPRGDDSFGLADARAAFIYNALSKRFFPAGELAYQGDLTGYNSLSIIPEFVVMVCPHFELKAGFPIGISGDGQRWGATVQAGIKF